MPGLDDGRKDRSARYDESHNNLERGKHTDTLLSFAL